MGFSHDYERNGTYNIINLQNTEELLKSASFTFHFDENEAFLDV